MKKSATPTPGTPDADDEARLADALHRIADELDELTNQLRSQREANQ